MAKKTTAAKKPTGPDVLLARLTPVPEAFAALEASYLSFPHYPAIIAFQRAVVRPGEPRTPPLRRLNNLLLACLPTLTHGFEYSSSGHRMLAVGTPGVPLAAPKPSQVHQLVLAWASHWARPYLTEKPQACQQFMDALERVSMPTWQRLSPLSLVQNPDEAGNIIYAAIPALLATLLHGQQLVINEGKQTLRLRKVQGDASNQAGLYVVSKPFRGHYLQVDRNTGEAQPKEGYFAYRIDFKVETQAGRFYENSQHLQPWIFLRISCQRYGHRPLSGDNFGRDLSVLTSSNQPRLPHAKTDGTLVRLQAGTRRGEAEYQWLDELRELLEEANARALVPAEDVLRKQPGSYGVAGDTQNELGDEYYVVHAEGYKYEKKKHSIKTGFHFDERRDILDQLLTVLNGVLLPDSPLPADMPLPIGMALPAALRPFKSVRGTALRQHPSVPPVPVETVKPRRAAKPSMQVQLHSRLSETMLGLAPGEQAQLLLVYREKSTHDIMMQQVRRTLLLAADEEIPVWLAITEVLITDATLLDFHEKCAKQAKRLERKAHYRRQHELKREAWKALLLPYRSTTANIALAFIEIGEPTVDEPRKIRGAVREACARLRIGSQMLHTAKYAKRKGELTTEFGWDVQSRVANAALDLLIRQPGVLAGPPSEAYAKKKAGLPDALANCLDVVALYRHKHKDSGLHYALAVRLRATGEVEVLFPQEKNWLPYAAAGPHLGNFFADKRREKGSASGQSIGLEMSATQLGQFAASVVTAPHERPTLVLIEADVWRNDGAYNKTWGQLKNNHLAAQRDCLDFTHLHGQGHYDRADPALVNLLGVVRLRMNHETPQYLPAVAATQSAQDFKPLSGFIDRSTPELWHYFSVGRAATTQKNTGKSAVRGLFKMDARENEDGTSSYGAGTAFRHQQVVEVVPFFVKPELQHEEGLLALCRIPHYLRNSPAWSTANTLLPFPMHLAKCLIEDYICVLGS
jgi:hypothetical protein